LPEVSAGLPPVRLDAVQIEQVLTDLIENAAKYAPRESPLSDRRLDTFAGKPRLAVP
jgi:signal transduction histidine kinase